MNVAPGLDVFVDADTGEWYFQTFVFKQASDIHEEGYGQTVSQGFDSEAQAVTAYLNDEIVWEA